MVFIATIGALFVMLWAFQFPLRSSVHSEPSFSLTGLRDDTRLVGMTEELGEVDSFRILVWNVARGTEFEQIVNGLKSVDAHFLILQEVDHRANRSARRDVAGEIAEALGMGGVFGVEFVELGQRSGAEPALHGQTTLSRFPLRSSRILRFGHQSTFWAPRWYLPHWRWTQRRLGGRMALVTEHEVNGNLLVTYNLHLESRSSPSLRTAQLEEILTDAQQYSLDDVVLLAGDFNLDLRQEVPQQMLAQEDFHCVLELPDASEDRRLVDWMFVRGAVTWRDGQLRNDIGGSDHIPLVVDFLPMFRTPPRNVAGDTAPDASASGKHGQTGGD